MMSPAARGAPPASVCAAAAGVFDALPDAPVVAVSLPADGAPPPPPVLSSEMAGELVGGAAPWPALQPALSASAVLNSTPTMSRRRRCVDPIWPRPCEVGDR